MNFIYTILLFLSSISIINQWNNPVPKGVDFTDTSTVILYDKVMADFQYHYNNNHVDSALNLMYWKGPHSWDSSIHTYLFSSYGKMINYKYVFSNTDNIDRRKDKALYIVTFDRSRQVVGLLLDVNGKIIDMKFNIRSYLTDSLLKYN